MVTRPVSEAERHLLANYQHLMLPPERMVARALVAADYDLDAIPSSIWRRVWEAFPGIDREDPWKLPLRICTRSLNEHRREISLPR